MALDANALVDLASMKIYLNIPSGETSKDDLVEDFINEASTLIEKYCNRIFRQQTFTEYYNGAGIHQIYLAQWPITTVNEVNVDKNRDFATETIVDPSNYDLFKNEEDENFIIERFDSFFPRGRKNVKIEYVAGYAALDDVPRDLRLACKIVVSFYFEQQQQKNWTFSNKQKGDENITLVQGIPESAALILDNYKRLEMIAPSEPIRNL